MGTTGGIELHLYMQILLYLLWKHHHHNINNNDTPCINNEDAHALT